jgi:hypothetical protein
VTPPATHNEQYYADFILTFKPMSYNFKTLPILTCYRGADKSLARPGRKQATEPEDFDLHTSFHNCMNISNIYIYKTRLASNDIFSISNKIHREVGRAKDLSAPLYMAIRNPNLFRITNERRPSFTPLQCYCDPLRTVDQKFKHVLPEQLTSTVVMKFTASSIQQMKCNSFHFQYSRTEQATKKNLKSEHKWN